MIEIFKNTLEIIGKMSQSSSGYILKADTNNHEVIYSFGRPGTVYNSFIDEFIKLGFDDKTVSPKLEKLQTFKELSNKFTWNSVFAKNIFFDDVKNEVYYLFLFSEIQDNYNQARLKSIYPAINVLSDQLNNLKSAGQLSKPASKRSKQNLNGFLKNNINKFFDLVLEASEDFIFVLDQNGCFIKVNDFGAASLDFDTNELIGQHLMELVSSKDKASFAGSIQKIIETDKLQLFETTLISKFGNEVTFEISGRAFKKNGQICGICGVGKNISEIKILETKINELKSRLIEDERIISLERQRSQRQKSILSELNRMKSEFVSNISHELRTPLASIIGFSETVASDPNMPVEMKNEFNEIILNEGKRLAKLINEVLDISRIESGEIEINKTEFDVVELLNEVLETNKKYVDEKNIALTTELPSEKIILKADKEKISRVINGILNNAVKFTNIKGRITVLAQSLYKEFEISIIDTGIGIPEKDLPYIFQKFYKVSRPGTEIPGTGLGLVFAKQIVDLHKGFISIQSGVNKGTTVIIKLPR